MQILTATFQSHGQSCVPAEQPLALQAVPLVKYSSAHTSLRKSAHKVIQIAQKALAENTVCQDNSKGSWGGLGKEVSISKTFAGMLLLLITSRNPAEQEPTGSGPRWVAMRGGQQNALAHPEQTAPCAALYVHRIFMSCKYNWPSLSGLLHFCCTSSNRSLPQDELHHAMLNSKIK